MYLQATLENQSARVGLPFADKVSEDGRQRHLETEPGSVATGSLKSDPPGVVAVLPASRKNGGQAFSSARFSGGFDMPLVFRDLMARLL